MRLKLDENIGSRGIEALEAAGHNVKTVWDQGLASAPDTEVIAACRDEARCLVTLDLDSRTRCGFAQRTTAGLQSFGSRRD